MEAVLIVGVSLVILIWYSKVGTQAISATFANTVEFHPLKRTALRSAVAAAFFGIGFIGAEGFGLPAPALYGLVVSLLFGASTAWISIAGFGASWLVLFLTFLAWDHVAAVRGRPPMQAPKSGWTFFIAVFVMIYIAAIAPFVFQRFVFGDERDVNAALLQYRESLPKAVNARWEETGELICDETDLINSIPKPQPSDLEMTFRVEDCGKYRIDIVAKGKTLGGIGFNAAVVETDEETYLDWVCSMATYVNGQNWSMVRCAQRPQQPQRLVSMGDFEVLVASSWFGTMSIYDQADEKPSQEPVSMTASTEDNALVLSFEFPADSALNRTYRFEVSDDWPKLGGDPIVDRELKPDGTLRLITQPRGPGEQPSSRERRIFLIREDSFVMRIIASNPKGESLTTEFEMGVLGEP